MQEYSLPLNALRAPARHVATGRWGCHALTYMATVKVNPCHYGAQSRTQRISIARESTMAQSKCGVRNIDA